MDGAGGGIFVRLRHCGDHRPATGRSIRFSGSARPLISVAALLCSAILLGGCFSHPAAQLAAGPVFPAGCGPRYASQPPANALPASPEPPGRVLPVYGGPVPDHGLAAAGDTVAAFAGPAWAVPDPLYLSTDEGRHWTPVPVPPVNGSMTPIILSANGRRLAGSDLKHLYVLKTPTGRASPPVWVTQPVQNLFALAFDPTDSRRLIGLGGTLGNGNNALLYLSNDGGRTLSTRTLPAPLGRGEGIAFLHGTAVVALGQDDGSIRLLTVPLTGAVAPTLPKLPAAVESPIYTLTTGPDGRLYLATGSGLFVLPARGGSWQQIPLPQEQNRSSRLYLAVTGRNLYLAADTQASQGTLWRGSTAGTGWRPVPVPGGFIGQPVADGEHVWVPTDAGPVLVGTTGGGQVRADGIAAPVSVVASAAWRPTRMAAGWSGGLFFSSDGGRTWTGRTPPGNPVMNITQLTWTPDGGCIALLYGKAGPGPAEAYLSDNNGRTWWRVSAPGAGWISTLTESPPGSGVWWITEGGPNPGLYRSAPGRATWKKVALPAGAGNPGRLAPARDGLWLGGLSFGVWRLRLPPAERGLAGWWARLTGRPEPKPTFTHMWGGGVAFDGLFADPYDPAVVYSGLRRTADGGRTWGLPQPGSAGVLPTAPVRGMAFGPNDPGAVLVMPRALVRDDGRAWVPFWSPPGPGQYITGVAPAGPGRFYVAVEKLGLVVAREKAVPWHAPATPPGQGRWTPPRGAPGAFHLEVAAPSDPRTVYRLTPGGRLAVSHDGGRTFTALPDVAVAGGHRCCTPSGVAGPHVVASVLAVSPADPERLYVGLALQGAAGFQPQLGTWVSADGGRTWRPSGLPSNLAVEGLAAVPGATDTLYAIAYPGSVISASKLWRSTDGGATWVPVPGVTGPVYSVAAPTATQVLVGGAGDVWRSMDGGRTFTARSLTIRAWRQTGPGAPGLPVVAVLQAPDGTLFAGTGQGVARSRDGGRKWQVISEPVGDPPVLPGGLSPQPGGSVSVATQYGTFLYRPRGTQVR